jgi:uncharacterized heparinase superfamily protein
MDQNEEIFVRFMNDASFQKIVTAWMASEAYRRLRSDLALQLLFLFEVRAASSGTPNPGRRLFASAMASSSLPLTQLC